MRNLGLLLMLFAGASLALSSCGNDSGEPYYGKIEYDGKTFKINPYYVDVALPGSVGFSSYSCLMLTNASLESGVSSVYLFLEIEDPRENFEYNVKSSPHVSFMHDKTYYRSSLNYDENNNTFNPIWSVKSLGIDPATGGVYTEGKQPVFKWITGGRVKWTAEKNSAKLEFNLTLDDGKTAKGSANVPYSVFRK